MTIHKHRDEKEQTYSTQAFDRSGRPWSSLVEGDEQLDRPNSQTSKDSFHANAAYFYSNSHR